MDNGGERGPWRAGLTDAVGLVGLGLLLILMMACVGLTGACLGAVNR